MAITRLRVIWPRYISDHDTHGRATQAAIHDAAVIVIAVVVGQVVVTVVVAVLVVFAICSCKNHQKM